MASFRQLATAFINEELKITDASINKIAKVVSKAYNLGKMVSNEFTPDTKSPTLMIKFEKLTVVFVKGFDWQDSVDMGIWKKKEYVKAHRAMDTLDKSDVIYYDYFSTYSQSNTGRSKNVLDRDISMVVRPVFGLKAEVKKQED